MGGEISNLAVCLMGIGTVFVGLICIIILTRIMSAIIQSFTNRSAKTTQAEAAAPESAAQPAQAQPIDDREEIIAAVSAAIAEMLGTNISAIRVVSFKKL